MTLEGLIELDGETYWTLAVEGDHHLWMWDSEDPWIGGYVDPRRIQWYREAGLFLEDTFE